MHLVDYDRLFDRKVQIGLSSVIAAVMMAEAYLDGKPRQRGKHKISNAERDDAFWSSEFLTTLPAEAWCERPLVLALARYMGQERVSNIADPYDFQRNQPIRIKHSPGNLHFKLG